MNRGSKLKVFLLFAGDAVLLYAALLATLFIRYDGAFWRQFVDIHAAPFTIVFIPWLLVFYIAGLYDLRRLRNNLDFLKTLSLALVANALIASLLFYLVPSFGIAPKTNLFIFLVLFAVIEALWRRFFNRMTASGEAPNRLLLVGDGGAAAEIEDTLTANVQLGYAVVARLAEDEAARDPKRLAALVAETRANLIAVPAALKRRRALAPALYALFGRGISVTDVETLYETVMRKVPLDEVEETWFLENIEGAARFYDQFKRGIEFAAALAIGVALLPIELAIALLVAVTSRGPAIYRQTRVGAHGRRFTLYKFRTMRTDAEAGTGARWADGAHDPRITAFGRFLRTSHLDELPQLWNIVRGDLSFVGPRPERPEFVEKLRAEVPFYEVRLLALPGVTGWAQINHRADRTTDDVREKLRYDIYYLKHRSPILDLAIVLRTLKSLFVNPE